MKKKKNILCICAQGLNRSHYLAGYLRNKGYKTKYGGIELSSPNPVNEFQVDWADVIVVVRKRLVRLVKKKFNLKGKKIIVIDVIDSPRLIPEQYAHLKLHDYLHFQKRWTYPQLRKAIKEYLPL